MISPGYCLALSVLLLALTAHLQLPPGCAAAREFPAGTSSAAAKPQAPLAVGTTAPAGLHGKHTTPQVTVHGRTTIGLPGGGTEGQYKDLKAECACQAGCRIPGAPCQRSAPISRPPVSRASGPRGASGAWSWFIGKVHDFFHGSPPRIP
ncbi:hypothetical protein PVAP13_7KG126200 [Panicum virgatum]|uniref:Uncharacterized protein n=1 Tax=Panicum virgatum TaxID=38727 RepID=A0A8T0QE34_PANVG|nr:hypothetical protein PVAP13_7KG126200 [Panicum virgatum]